MKKVFAFLAVIGILSFGVSTMLNAQEAATADSTAAVQEAAAVDTASTVAALAAEEEVQPMHQQVKAKFIEGGPGFMTSILLCLIFGLAIAIERIIYLNLTSTNTEKLLNKLEAALNEGGIEAAKEVCRNTRGPVASIFYQGLERYDEGLDMVEKSVVSYGSVQMGLLEKNLSWIALFIALAPMLGFLGTVYGMVVAFDNIAKAGDVSATIVAEGIGIALLTTLFGLIVAIILQVFYNYLLSKIDSIVNKMEDSSICLMDLLIRYNIKK